MDRIKVACSNELLNVAVTIEPRLQHLLGVHLQHLSLIASSAPFKLYVCILHRNESIDSVFNDFAHQLGLSCSGCLPVDSNPYINKWCAFKAFPDLEIENCVMLVDWDTIFIEPRDLPQIHHLHISCRGNPSLLYSDVLAEIGGKLPPTSSIAGTSVTTSVNGGVIVGRGKQLVRCFEAVQRWVKSLRLAGATLSHWQEEQLGLSLALGETGLVQLEPEWNATPLSAVRDANVRLWHYNDGHRLSRQLKRDLLQPNSVSKLLSELAKRWPNCAASFARFYGQIWSTGVFKPFLH